MFQFGQHRQCGLCAVGGARASGQHIKNMQSKAKKSKKISVNFNNLTADKALWRIWLQLLN